MGYKHIFCPISVQNVIPDPRFKKSIENILYHFSSLEIQADPIDILRAPKAPAKMSQEELHRLMSTLTM